MFPFQENVGGMEDFSVCLNCEGQLDYMDKKYQYLLVRAKVVAKITI